MVRPSHAAALALTTALALGCATASESDGTYNDRDAEALALDAKKDAGAGDDDARDAAADEAAVIDAGRDAGGDARAEAGGVDRPDAGVAADVTAAVDRPAADVDPGSCTEGSNRPCYTGTATTRGVGLCADGFQRCVGGRWGVECNGEIRPQVEECNTIDDDCDGVVDNITAVTCYTGPPGTRGMGICHEGMLRCNGAMAPLCTGQVVPETREVCANGRDDNCNGITDEAGCF